LAGFCGGAWVLFALERSDRAIGEDFFAVCFLGAVDFADEMEFAGVGYPASAKERKRVRAEGVRPEISES